MFYRLDLFCLEGSFSFSVNNDINLFRIIKTNKIIANSLFDGNLGNEIIFLVSPINVTKTLHSISYIPSNSYSGSETINLTVTSLIPLKEINILNHQINGKREIESYNDGISVNSKFSFLVEPIKHFQFICSPKIEILEKDFFNLGETKHFNFKSFSSF